MKLAGVNMNESYTFKPMSQSARNILLIRPSHFGFNEQTAASNRYQHDQGGPDVVRLARTEFNAFADRLSGAGINTIIFDDNPSVTTPDSVFPNNWVSFHPDGKVILYPMESALRRLERRRDILDSLSIRFGFMVTQVTDLSEKENNGVYLEGTGSIVFDHVRRVAYMAVSSRSDRTLFEHLCKELGYVPMVFETLHDGTPIYHTNVLMTVGTGFAVICHEVIARPESRNQVLESFETSNRIIIEITPAQMASFAGNMLEVQGKNGEPFIVLSESALKSLKKAQLRALEQHGTLLDCPVPVIEKVGGGSVRCMMAEMFLPLQQSDENILIRPPQNTKEFDEYFALRWKLLRKPWGQPFENRSEASELHSRHYVAVSGQGAIVGCGRLLIIDRSTVQVRSVGVDERLRGRGIGKKLMLHMEHEARSSGHTRVFLQARENAVPFYQSLGYRILEKTHLLFNEIQHYSMEKLLS